MCRAEVRHLDACQGGSRRRLTRASPVDWQSAAAQDHTVPRWVLRLRVSRRVVGDVVEDVFDRALARTVDCFGDR